MAIYTDEEQDGNVAMWHKQNTVESCTTMDLELLEQAVLNQIEADLNDSDFDAFSEMMQLLMKDEKNRLILFNYLSDTAQKNLKESKTVIRY